MPGSHCRSAISYRGRISISLGPGMGLGQRFTHATASSISLTSQNQKPATSSRGAAKADIRLVNFFRLSAVPLRPARPHLQAHGPCLPADLGIDAPRRREVGIGAFLVALFFLGDAAIVEEFRLARLESDGLVQVLD